MKARLDIRSTAGVAGKLAVALALLCLTNTGADFAQSANEANRMLSGIQENDPQGFTWMFICIGLILTCAVALITATTILAVKGKKGS